MSTEVNQIALNALAAKTYQPEAAASGSSIFKQLMQGATNVLSAAGGVAGQYISNMATTNNELIMMQIQMQQEMQKTSMISNIEKSKHETKMAPIRNIKVG